MFSPDSQNGKIYKRLRRRCGAWVSMPLLAKTSGSLNVHSRISDLSNRYGASIENKTLRRADGMVLSFYRLRCPI